MTAPDPQSGASPSSAAAAPDPTAPQGSPQDSSQVSSASDHFLFPRPLRPFAVALGLVFTVLGLLGTVLPLLPGTGFLIAAVWLFARSSPRFEAWLLGLPLVGPLVDDFRSGAGMPLRAKWLACSSIALAVGLSLGRIPVLVGQVAWVLIGVAGIWYITQRVPTKQQPPKI